MFFTYLILMYNYRFVLSLFCSILCASSVFADSRDYIYSFDTVYAPREKVYYDKLRVMDQRSYKLALGTAKTGAFNREAAIKTIHPMDEELSNCYERMIAHAEKEKGELLMVIYDFNIQDRPTKAETGAFYFNADFYFENNGKYSFAGNIDSLMEIGSNLDVTKRIIGASQYAVCGYINMFATVPPDTDANYITVQEVLQRRKKKKEQYPIYTATEYKKGMYLTSTDFLNNTPSDTPFIIEYIFESNTLTKHALFYSVNAKGKKGKRIKEKYYFAVYDGAKWYASDWPYCVPMKYENEEFTAVKTFRSTVSNNNGAALATFGLLGGLVASAMEDKGYEVEKGRGSWQFYRSHFNPQYMVFRPVSVR